MLASKPSRRRAQQRQNSSTDAIDLRVLVKRAFNGGNPILRHSHIIICECDDFRASHRDPGIAPIGRSLPWLEDVPKIVFAAGDISFYDFSSIIGRVVVYHYHFVAHTAGLLT